LSHYGKKGEVRMVDVSDKAVTMRTAAARGFVRMKPRVVSAVRRLKNPKGNPLEVARIAGIAAAKKTAEWIPLCHPLPLTHIDVTARLCQNGVEVRSTVTTAAQTEVEISTDGADALLKVVDAPPDVILCDYKMPGLDGRQLFEKLRARESTRHIPFLFMASRPDIEERLRPLVDGVEDFIPKPFLIKDLVRITKKVVDRLHLEKLQKKASRPGVIQGRLEEMSMIDLMQSLEMGQKSCRLIVQSGGAQGELYFAGGQCRDAKIGKLEGDNAVYKVVLWTAGEFEIDFNAANASTRTTTTRNTTGLLMEAMRLMDEANRDTVETQ